MYIKVSFDLFLSLHQGFTASSTYIQNSYVLSRHTSCEISKLKNWFDNSSEIIGGLYVKFGGGTSSRNN